MAITRIAYVNPKEKELGRFSFKEAEAEVTFSGKDTLRFPSSMVDIEIHRMLENDPSDPSRMVVVHVPRVWILGQEVKAEKNMVVGTGSTGMLHPHWSEESIKGNRPRTFVLRRDEDVTGISGTGIVAEGIEFTDGRCALRWLTDVSSTVVYDSVADVEKIHGHNGSTKIIFFDKEGEDA